MENTDVNLTPEVDETTKDGTETSQNKTGEEKEVKMLNITQEELDEILEKRLSRQEEKLKKEFKEQREEEIRKSKLTQAEKEAEAKKELEDKLAQAINENRLIKLENRTSELLTEYELPQVFKSFLMGSDEDSTVENIKKFNEIYREEVKNATEEKWKNKAPGTGSRDIDSTDTIWGEIVNKYK